MKKLLYLLAAFIPGVAFAGLPEPVAGEKAIVALQAIFGKLFGGMTDALGTMNETYIGYVLMAAGAMAAYTIITGLMSTAHYGEMMGKTYSSLWIPVKYAIGVALIIPINNWCTGQYIVADLIKTSLFVIFQYLTHKLKLIKSMLNFCYDDYYNSKNKKQRI